ncbi:ATP-binding protein [Thermosyntropha sp.]|uniref:sensor histidine kinase n=1 Tax=Thermosyntropha sp. TaxID=2740820 RepID=UPI0025D1EEAE|nr:ATP-binding protein [Thermosyntropha sp.]MBO8158944.1 GHKL domain-containing protein [Thermosyntropha sp.]
MSKDKLVITTVLVQTLILLLISNQILTSDNLTNLKDSIPYINLVIVGLSILSIISIKNIDKNARYKIKAMMLKSTLTQVEELLRALQMQRHEYARHIETVQALVELERIEEAKHYIEGITESYWPNYEYIYVDNPALATLLNTKKAAAEKQGIDFAFAVKCELDGLDIPPWDLCSIIGNLLDNAIEAAMEDEQNPRVAIEFTYSDDSYYVYIFNNGYPFPPEAKFYEPGFTTKGSNGRGYGLYITKKLVEQYNGEIKISSFKKGTAIYLNFPSRRIKDDSGYSTKYCQEIG